MTKPYRFKDYYNFFGWHTNRRIIVLESDDWGSIRMPSYDTFEKLANSGIDLVNDEGQRFNRYDALATSEDLSLLFEVLSSTFDKHHRPAVITPLAVVANPDFSKIKESKYTHYFYEPFTTTLKRFPGCENSFNLWKEGIEKRLFLPQFHGREHLNVIAWMNALRSKHRNTMTAFENQFWGFSTSKDPDIGIEFQAAFDFIEPEDIKYHKEVITTGLSLFKEIMGYNATYFVPPNGPFSSKLEETCKINGIDFVSVPRIQIEPLGNWSVRKRFHWLGKRNKSGLYSITRNCFFEPGIKGKDWVSSCLNDILTAFKWNQPAIISSHRVNFIGAISNKNRDLGLTSLRQLLKSITKEWPDVEFITSEELGRMIVNDRK